MNFEPIQRKLNIRVDFEVGSRFAVPGQAGMHPVHDTVTKTYRHPLAATQNPPPVAA